MMIISTQARKQFWIYFLKIRTRNTPNTDTFYAVIVMDITYIHAIFIFTGSKIISDDFVFFILFSRFV